MAAITILGKMKHFLSPLTYSIMIASCSAGGGNTGGSNSTTVLGVLPSGSAVVSSVNSYTLSSGTSANGSIYLSGGVSGYSYSLSLTTNNSGITSFQTLVSNNTSIPTSNCILISGNNTTCQITISASTTVPIATYTLTPTFTNTSSQTLSTVNTLPIKIVN